MESLQRRVKRISERGSGDFCCEPGVGTVTEQVHNPSRGGQGHNGQARGGSLQKRIGHALVAGREHKKRSAGKTCVRLLEVAGKVDCPSERHWAFSDASSAPAPAISRSACGNWCCTQTNACSNKSNPFSRESLPTASRWGPAPVH